MHDEHVTYSKWREKIQSYRE